MGVVKIGMQKYNMHGIGQAMSHWSQQALGSIYFKKKSTAKFRFIITYTHT